MQIYFIGAIRNITGLKHIIETHKNYKLLLDCSMRQGKRSEVNNF